MLTWIVLALVIGIIFWQVIWPNMRLGTGGSPSAPTGTGATAAPTTRSGTPPKGTRKWAADNVWSLLFIVVGVLAVYWASKTQITTRDAGSWAWDNWRPLLVAWVFVSAFIALHAKTLGEAAGKLQWGLAILMLILFIVLPIIGWFNGSSDKPKSAESATLSRPVTMIPLASSPRSAWSKVTIPAGGESERIPLPASMHRIRVDGGKYQLYSVYADGKKCAAYGTPTCPDGAVIEYYVVNEEAANQTVLYSFVPN